MEKKKRKNISYKTTLQVFKRDNYTCQICGRSPVSHPGLSLEVDHKIPFSKGGTNDIENLQTKCLPCNRGKGNNEDLDRTLKSELHALLNYVNPEILEKLSSSGEVRIVANQEEFSEIEKRNCLGNFYQISIIPNTIIGIGAGKNLGIYTLRDKGGTKINFLIKDICSSLCDPNHSD